MNLRAKLTVTQDACETGLALDRAGVAPTGVTVRSTVAAVSTLVLSLQSQLRTVLFENHKSDCGRSLFFIINNYF